MVSKILGYAAQVAPWAVVAGLGYAAAFVNPTVEPLPLPQPLIEPRDIFYDVASYAGKPFWFVGNNGTVLEAPRGTGNWTRHELPEPVNLQGVAVADNGNVVAVGNHGAVFVLKDGETEWSIHRLPVSERAGKMVEAAWINDAFWVIGEMGAIYQSDATASAWKNLGIDQDMSLNDIAKAPDGKLWIAAEFGVVLQSTDAGQSWTQAEHGRESLRSLAFDSSVSGVIVGNNGTILYSDNTGESWRSITPITEEHLYDVEFDGDAWIAVGNSGVVLTSANGQGWEQLKPEGFGRGYNTRLLTTDDGVVIAGQTIGKLSGSTWNAWPVEEN